MLMYLVLALSVPFELNVDFNDDEFCTAETSAVTCEFAASNVADTMGAGGILGFNMCFQQIDT